MTLGCRFSGVESCATQCAELETELVTMVTIATQPINHRIRGLKFAKVRLGGLSFERALFMELRFRQLVCASSTDQYLLVYPPLVAPIAWIGYFCRFVALSLNPVLSKYLQAMISGNFEAKHHGHFVELSGRSGSGSRQDFRKSGRIETLDQFRY